MESNYFTPAQLAAHLGVDRTWVYRKVMLNEIPHVRLGHGPKAPIRFDKSVIGRWVAQQTMDGTGPRRAHA